MEFLQKHKRSFVIAVVLLCLAIMAYSVYYRQKPNVAEDILGYAVTPLQGAIASASGWVSDKISYYREISEVNSQNTALKEENDLLKIENGRLKQLEREYASLTSLLQMKDYYSGYPTVGVSIIGKNPGNWYDNFTIDKGSGDLIEKDMVVIGVGGLVGRVMESADKYSKVRSLMDETFSVSAMNMRTEDTGIVKGDMKLKEKGLLKMERIDKDADIIPGDTIVTSNLGRLYPPGISIGIVQEISANNDALTKSAVIQPMVNFDRLSTLLVINEVFVKDIAEGQLEDE